MLLSVVHGISPAINYTIGHFISAILSHLSFIFFYPEKANCVLNALSSVMFTPLFLSLCTSLNHLVHLCSLIFLYIYMCIIPDYPPYLYHFFPVTFIWFSPTMAFCLLHTHDFLIGAFPGTDRIAWTRCVCFADSISASPLRRDHVVSQSDPDPDKSSHE